MNTIEQAAKRLAELKRAGYDVPVPDIPGAPPAVAAVDGVVAAAVPEPVAAPAVPEVPAHAPTLKVASSAPVQLPTVPRGGTAVDALSPNRRSREVTLDLARLEREGYLVPTQARSQLAEQMRIIKRPLLANARGESAQQLARPNLIQVVSAMPGEGKTFFAINLAMSIAMEVDLSVLLVDADVLRPSVLARCGVEPSRGLMDVLKSPNIELHDVMLRTNVPKLTLLPAGTANAQSTELLASAAMDKLLDDLAAKFSDRIVVFDAPPLIPTTESRVLASRVGQVVMVVESGKTTHAQVTQAYAAVEQCPVVLSVLNRARGNSGEAYGYYYAT
jgi:receptor protein-tyrosine kinase